MPTPGSKGFEPRDEFTMLRSIIPAAIVLQIASIATFADDSKPLVGVHRVVFLGDSITHSGQYIEYVEAYLRSKNPDLQCEFLNLSLPSETVSGLTEPGHAGGKFPRPDLHERLVRVLEQTKPDLVVACYGMNDGIYHPYSDERFQKYRDGITRLREKVIVSKAKLLLMTPPVFDSVPIQPHTLAAGLPEYRQPYEGYDEVLNLYSAWLLAQRGNGWDVVDIHGPMKQFLANQRDRDPKFRLAGDGVHIDSTGHWLIARELLEHLGIPREEVKNAASGEQKLGEIPHGLDVLKLVARKQRLLREAWLASVGHQRPGMATGLPIDEAQKQAKGIEEQIHALLAETSAKKP